MLKGLSLRGLQRGARVLAVVLAVGLPALLLVGGSHPAAAQAIAVPWDKLVHIGVYALLSCAIGFASGRHGFTGMAIGFAGAMLVGLADEGHQMFLPGRAADVDDLIANAVGAALGTSVLAVRIYVRQWVAMHVDQ